MLDIQWENLVSGTAGGAASTLLLHPLDLLKVRLQVQEGANISDRPQYRSARHAFRTIGSVRPSALFQGVVPNLCGSASSWGLYFFFYAALKRKFQDGDECVALRPWQHLTAGAIAGCTTLCFTNPLWVAKTRLCLQYEAGRSAGRVLPSSGTANKAVHGVVAMTSRSSPLKYMGMVHCLSSIYRSDGLVGWYRGFLPGLFGISHGAVQFMLYEEMKNRYNQYHRRSIVTQLTIPEYIFFSATSKLCAVAFTYPYQVLRTRLQDQHRRYSGIVDVTRQLVHNEGLLAFYKGLAPSLMRVVPACCITFVVYENLNPFLRRLSAGTVTHS